MSPKWGFTPTVTDGLTVSRNEVLILSLEAEFIVGIRHKATTGEDTTD
jgi:hypothetical protein